MKKLALLLAIATAPALAQFSTGGGPKPGPTAPNFAMPAGKIEVNVSLLPGHRAGNSSARFTPSGCTTTGYSSTDATKWPTTSGQPTNCNAANSPTIGSGGGAFRTFCALSHVGFDDPIVWPGQAGRTHLHAFYGNTLTGAGADPALFHTFGQSTCMGGTLNRTGYWAPVFIYHCPPTATYGSCNSARNGEPLVARRFNAYYKTLDETHGSIPQWPLPGLRMIAGDPTNTNPANLGDKVYFECWINGTTPIGGNPFVNTAFSYRFDHLPTSADGVNLSTHGGQGSGGCTSVLMEVVLPACMSTALDLDSPDHKSHMAYAAQTGPSGPTGKEGCPNSGGTAGYQGRQIPEISVLVHTPVNNADLDYIRLSSDQPRADAITAAYACATSGKNYCAGMSAHADWVNGWDQTTEVNGSSHENVTDVIRRECYYVNNTSFRSCSDGVLGDLTKNGTYYWMY